MTPRQTGFILLAITSLSWGSNWPAMKLALTIMGPWTFRTSCIFFGGIVLFLIALTSRQTIKLPRKYWIPMIRISLFNVIGWHLFSAFGLLYLPAGKASLLAFGFPFWTALFGYWWLHEKPVKRQWLGITLGLLAILWLFSDAWSSALSSPMGSFLMIMAGVSLAIGSVDYRRSNIPLPSITITAWMLLVGTIPLAIGAWVFESEALFYEGDPRAWYAFWYALIVAMVIGQFSWFASLQRLPAYIASAGLTPIPVIGLAASAWLLGEEIGFVIAGPAVLLMVGLLLVATPTKVVD